MDIHIKVKAVPATSLLNSEESEPSCDVAKRVGAARAVQLSRFGYESLFKTNSVIPNSLMVKYCKIGVEETDFLRSMIEKFSLSARAYSRILKLSRTIADLDGADFISLGHISEAIQFRYLDRE